MERQYQLAADICLEAGLEHKWNELKLEHDGGVCPICSTPLRLRVGGQMPRDNRTDLFFYWMPACSCYPTCPTCGRVMIEETFEGIDWCRNCHYGPKQEKKKRRRASSREPAPTSGKDAAAGDREEEA
jgi:hypothetical protein